MPQITLKVSKNINLNLINFKPVFEAIHEAMTTVTNMDVRTCNSGVIQEAYSFIGLGEENLTKAYLEILWLENPERIAMKTQLAQNLMAALEKELVPLVELQGMICVPRVRIANLGENDEDYFIGKRKHST